MQLLLGSKRSWEPSRSLIPDKALWKAHLESNPAYHDKFFHLGYHYQFTEKILPDHALIVANSDQIQHIRNSDSESLPMAPFELRQPKASQLLTTLSQCRSIVQSAKRELYQPSDFIQISLRKRVFGCCPSSLSANMLILVFFDQTAS